MSYTVMAYHGPHIGMEIEGLDLTRSQAWEICLRFGAGRASWPAASYVEVFLGDEIVWSKGSIECVDHSHWLDRCRG